MQNFSPDQLLRATVFDQSGTKVGKVEQVYLNDATGEPSWVTVRTGFFGTNESLIPLHGAQFDNDALRVPFDKQTIKAAPNYDPGHHLDESDENDLYRYYALDPSLASSDSNRGRDRDLGQRDNVGPSGERTGQSAQEESVRSWPGTTGDRGESGHGVEGEPVADQGHGHAPGEHGTRHPDGEPVVSQGQGYAPGKQATPSREDERHATGQQSGLGQTGRADAPRTQGAGEMAGSATGDDDPEREMIERERDLLQRERALLDRERRLAEKEGSARSRLRRHTPGGQL